MDLLTKHFWKFFFGLIVFIAGGIFTIYIASLFDGREINSQTPENGQAMNR